MKRNKDWPTEFLGRCQSCLDNAYLDSDCSYLGNYIFDNRDCVVKRTRAEIVAVQAPRLSQGDQGQ